ncbi:MAG: arsenate reductase (glutaredoxin) [Campylobacterota bacterium]|nr:arsenate reductase (glutaredoxin) [Campylobacterota bacterium]
MIKIWHNTRCSKSREAKTILEQSGQEFEVFEYLKNDINPEELKEIIKLLDISDVREMLRTKEDEYKLLDLANENKSDDELIGAMILFPKLIERPIIIKEDKAVIARPMENLTNLLGI